MNEITRENIIEIVQPNTVLSEIDTNENGDHYNESIYIKRKLLELYEKSIITPFNERKEIRKPPKKYEGILEEKIGIVDKFIPDIFNEIYRETMKTKQVF